jgi:hypothetical protein
MDTLEEINATNPKLYLWRRGMHKRILIGSFLLVLVLSFLLPCGFVKGLDEPPQIEWERLFDGTIGYSVLQTDDGGYLVLGMNSSDSLIVKMDSDGSLLWIRAYRLGTETNFPYLVKGEDEGYVLGGTLNNVYVIVKIDAQGNAYWNQSYSCDAPFNSLRAFIQTNDGGYALVGTISPLQNASHAIGQILFLKTDASGNMQWNKTISGPQGDFAHSILQAGDGGYVIFSTSWASDSQPSYFKMIKTDGVGNEQWNRTYGGEGKFFTAESSSGIITNDGGYLIAGVSSEKDSDWVAWLVKTDSQGNMMWNQNYGDIGSWALSVIHSQEGGYVFAGLHNRKEAWLVKIDSNGATEWDRTFVHSSIWGSSIEDFGKCLIQTKDGGYLMIGSKNSQIWVAKIAAPAPSSVGLVIAITLVAAAVVAVLVLVFLKKQRKTKLK